MFISPQIARAFLLSQVAMPSVNAKVRLKDGKVWLWDGLAEAWRPVCLNDGVLVVMEETE